MSDTPLALGCGLGAGAVPKLALLCGTDAAVASEAEDAAAEAAAAQPSDAVALDSMREIALLEVLASLAPPTPKSRLYLVT